MNRVALVLVREYLENVRTKAFVIGLIMTPVWMALVFVVPAMARGAEAATQEVAIVDETGALAEPLAARLRAIQFRGDRPRYRVTVHPAEGAWDPGPEGEEPLVERLRRRGGRGDVLAVVLTTPVLEKREARLEERRAGIYGSSGVSSLDAGREVQAIVNDLVNQRILEEHAIDREVARRLARDAMAFTMLTPEGREASAAFSVAPFVFMLFLFMGIVGISQMLISSTLEEKSSRVYELLLSSVSPFQLMAGKILGICGVGLTLLLLWSGGGLLAANIQGLGGIVTGAQLGWFLAYYLLGFLLIASLMVAVGSACNTLKEAQNLMAPISLLLALPLLLSLVILKNPNGSLATAVSFVPPFTPFVMMARLASVPAPPAWQAWASLALLAVSTLLAMRLAGRVFRVGILLYGKPPRLGEIWRWMRAP